MTTTPPQNRFREPLRYGAPQAPRRNDPLDGVLLIDKPAGPTSHDIVARVRRHFRIPKVGHGGTLDPQATGLLILLLGRGTKLSDRFLGSDKVYDGTLCLGVATDSQDADGEIVSQADPSAITEAMLLERMEALTGDIYQTPPMVSAKKIDGVPLYKRARKGQVIEREARIVHIYEFRMNRFDPPRADFIVRCSKGTYVRTLCADIGEALGCGAHLERLRRLASGSLAVENAFTMDQVLAWDPAELASHVLPMAPFI